MLVDKKKTIDRKLAFPIVSRRTFLRLTAHLALLSASFAVKSATAARLVQAEPQVSGYGRGQYGQKIYAGSVEHTIYLPLVGKAVN